MKGRLAVMLELAAAVQPAIDVTWVFYAGEEVSADHNGLRHLFAQRPDLVAGDAAVLGEPVPLSKWDARAPCASVWNCSVSAPTARPWMGRNVYTPARCLRPWTTMWPASR